MIALSSTSSSSTIARAPRAAFRGGRRAASPRKRVAIARASKDDDALSRNAKKALGALIAIPTSIALSSGAVALADDDAVDVFAAADATAEESAAFTAATAEDAAFEAPADAPDVAEAPVVEEAPPRSSLLVSRFRRPRLWRALTRLRVYQIGMPIPPSSATPSSSIVAT